PRARRAIVHRANVPFGRGALRGVRAPPELDLHAESVGHPFEGLERDVLIGVLHAGDHWLRIPFTKHIAEDLTEQLIAPIDPSLELVFRWDEVPAMRED